MFTIGPEGVTIDLKGSEELQRQLLRMKTDDLPRATATAIRYAASAAPAAVSKELKQRYQLPAARIRKDVKVPRVGPTAERAEVKLNRRPVTAMQFGARQIGERRPRRGLGRGKGWEGLKPSRRHGLAWKIMRGERRRFTPYGFIGKAPQGGLLPYIRRKDGTLKVVHGPSVHGMFTGGRHEAEAKQEVAKVLLDRLEVGMRRGIRQFGRER